MDGKLEMGRKLNKLKRLYILLVQIVAKVRRVLSIECH